MGTTDTSIPYNYVNLDLSINEVKADWYVGSVNPNGSPGGLTAVTTADGRFTAMMPHPERVFRNIQMSWTAGEREARSPWMRIWRNARRWVG